MKQLTILIAIKTFLIMILFSNSSCKPDQQKLAEGVNFPSAENFSTEINGKQVDLYTLENKNGLRADITNYGGRIVSLLVPDKNGTFEDIVTGYHTIDEYFESEEIYYGALIGRYANRIANAKFTLDGEEYTLAANDGPHHLHGGPGGFHNVVWDAEQPDEKTLKLSYSSPDMEEGYPGNLNVEVLYRLTDDNDLEIEYSATTDKKTVINLTSHAFFNLAGEGSEKITDHYLKINADYFTPVDEGLIPTGEIVSIENTPLDFREYTRIGERIESDHPQMIYGHGYDHNFVINRNIENNDLESAASVYDEGTGIKMEVLTTEPGMQFYSGNFLTGEDVGKRGEPYLHRTSFCLETQHFPDSPNKPEFPSTVLEPNEEFNSKTIYRFSIRNK